MILRLDPAVPLVWRDPHTLQLGVDRVVCVFAEPTATTERMLAALRTGVARSALEVEASRSATRADAVSAVDALLDAVHDALLGDEPAADRAIALDGSGPTAERLHRLLRECGYRVVTPERAGDEPGGVAAAVLIGSYVIPPWRHGPWLRRDIPHLPIVFGDAGVEVGPFVDSDGPCLRCLSLARTDGDPAWPAIATQLDAHATASEPTLLSMQAALTAARWLNARIRDGDRSHASTSIRIAPDGSVSERSHAPHGLCGCRALPENVTALVARPHSQPSSARAGAVPV